MNEPVLDIEEPIRKSKKPRQPKAERRVFIHRLVDGKPKEQGSFPEAVIGEPLERRLLTFLQDMYGAGEYKAEIRNNKGRFEQSYDFSFADAESQSEKIVDIDPQEFADDLEEFRFEENPGKMNAVEVENILLKERLKRIEDDMARQKTGTQSEMQTLITALEESRREQRELMMLMIAQAQQPQQDATTQAMNILEKSLGIVTKAKAISEEIAPQETSSNGSFLGDAARLIDSVGKNAGTFAPFIMNALGANRSTATQANVPPSPVSAPNGNGELANLAAKIQGQNSDKGIKEGVKK